MEIDPDQDKFCCDALQKNLKYVKKNFVDKSEHQQYIDTFNSRNECFLYDEVIRRFYIKERYDKIDIFFCPFCGEAFPASLREQYQNELGNAMDFDVVKEKKYGHIRFSYGVGGPLFFTSDRRWPGGLYGAKFIVPEEFLSDVWWKNRNL